MVDVAVVENGNLAFEQLLLEPVDCRVRSRLLGLLALQRVRRNLLFVLNFILFRSKRRVGCKVEGIGLRGVGLRRRAHRPLAENVTFVLVKFFPGALYVGPLTLVHLNFSL